MGSIFFPLHSFTPTLWRVPSLLQPRADVAEQLESAVVAAAALRRIRAGGEARISVSPQGGIWAAGDRRSGEVIQRGDPSARDSSETVLRKEDQRSLRNMELILAWQKLPWWGRWLARENYRLIKASENPGALELAAKLLEDYHRRSDFFRLAFGLMALGVASKHGEPDIRIVRLISFKREYVVDNEPAGKISGPEIRATHPWWHPELPKGVAIYVWGPALLGRG